MQLKLLKRAAIKTLPVMAGYIVLGTGFGILMNVNGYGVWWTLAMSVFIYAGSMQYVGVALLTSGASLISTAFTTLMVNARHLFYGISMVDRYKGGGIKKLYMELALTDETYSIVSSDTSPNDKDTQNFYFFVSLLNQVYWVIGSVLGAVLGTLLTFDTKGIDFSMTAFFITVFVEQWLTTKEHRPALIGVGASVLCLVIFGGSSFLIPSMAAIVALLTVCRAALEKGAE